MYIYYTHTHPHTHTCVHMYTLTHIHTYVCTYIRMYIYLQIYTYTHIYIIYIHTLIYFLRGISGFPLGFPTMLTLANDLTTLCPSGYSWFEPCFRSVILSLSKRSFRESPCLCSRCAKGHIPSPQSALHERPRNSRPPQRQRDLPFRKR